MKKIDKILNMKFILTESQFNDLFFKRRFGRIDQLVEEKMVYYPPCDYTYDPYYAFFDYLDDIINGVIHEMLSDDLSMEWDEGNMEKINDFSEMMTTTMSELFMDKVRNPDKYDDVTIENIREHINAENAQHSMNVLMKWVLGG